MRALLVAVGSALLMAGCADQEARKGVADLAVKVDKLRADVDALQAAGMPGAWARYSADDVFQDPDRVYKFPVKGGSFQGAVEYKCATTPPATGISIVSVTLPAEGKNVDAELTPNYSGMRLVARGESDGASLYLQSSEADKCQARTVQKFVARILPG